MKKLAVTMMAAAATLANGAMGISINALPNEVAEFVPKDIAMGRTATAEEGLRRLADEIKQCGSGVVSQVRAKYGDDFENRCTYEITLNDLFFKPLAERTGALFDKHWAQKDSVVWVKPAQTKDELPESFDLRDLMKNGLPDLRTQKCGDCWAWSTHHGLELARAVHDQTVVDHSIQTVLSCSRQGSCNGGYMSAVDFLKHGLPTETEFPYAASDARCKFTSAQINTGWDGKVEGTPYIGDSKMYSLAKRNSDGTFAESTYVADMAAAIYQWQSPLVVTVAAYDISGPGIYNSCSSINSGGNHMVTIVGWDHENGARNAHVWNSWGKGHGKDGVSRIKWECGSGRLNRGLGVAAKIVQYKPTCVLPDATQKYLVETTANQAVQIGAPQAAGVTCRWSPAQGLSDPNACVTTATASGTTEYHLEASNACGTSSSIALVRVAGTDKDGFESVLTPFGNVMISQGEMVEIRAKR